MIFNIKFNGQDLELEDESVVDAIIKIIDSGLYVTDNMELSIEGLISNNCYQNN